MSLDLAKVRNKLERLKNPGMRNFTQRIWKPKKNGELSTIRLIQYPFGEDPFVELWFHYSIGAGPGMLCPKSNFGRTCPICEFGWSLKESADGEDQSLARNFQPTQRIYAVVVDREDSTSSPKYWGFGKQVYQTLLEYLLNEDYGNYMSPTQGLDLDVKSEKSQGQSYPKTSVQFRRRETRLAETDTQIQKILNAIVPVDEVFKPLTTAEITQRLNEWMSFGEKEAEEVSGEIIKGKKNEEENPTTKTVAAVTKVLETNSVEDIDAAFEEALNS